MSHLGPFSVFDPIQLILISVHFLFGHFSFNENEYDNHVEGYNKRLGSLFPNHPHIFRFIELLRDEHLFQRYHEEESKAYLPRRQKSSQDISDKLIGLLHKHSNGELTDLELALHCGKAVKTKILKK